MVICGGGIAGLSAAYNLAKLGLTDVVLLEQGRWVDITRMTLTTSDVTIVCHSAEQLEMT